MPTSGGGSPVCRAELGWGRAMRWDIGGLGAAGLRAEFRGQWAASEGHSGECGRTVGGEGQRGREGRSEGRLLRCPESGGGGCTEVVLEEGAQVGLRALTSECCWENLPERSAQVLGASSGASPRPGPWGQEDGRVTQRPSSPCTGGRAASEQ